MTSAIPREQVEAGLAKAVGGLRKLVDNVTLTEQTAHSVVALASYVQHALSLEGLAPRHAQAMRLIAETYDRRCRVAGLEPEEFPS